MCCLRERLWLLSVLLLACTGGQCGRSAPMGMGQGGTTPPTAQAEDAAAGEQDGAADAPQMDAAASDQAADAAGDGGWAADAAGDAPEADVGGAEVDGPEFDEEEAIASIKWKKVPKIPGFKPSDQQEIADPKELEYLEDHDKTNKILAEAPWAKVEGEKTLVPMIRERKADGTSYRFRILVGFEGEDVITGFFKPRQANYWDWLKEIHAYNIGRMINAPTVPTVMRFMAKGKFSNFLAKITVALQDNFKWEGAKEDQLRGAFKYWVPSYRHRVFGSRVIDEEYMTEIAASLHPVNKKEIEESYPLYLELGRGVVFDYLVINEDRPENLGTIRMADGSHHIVLIDNGLALGVENGSRVVMKNIFKKMKIYPKDMIDAIRAMDKEEIETMLRPEDDKVMMLPEVVVKQFWKRRQFILDTVDAHYAKYGELIWY